MPFKFKITAWDSFSLGRTGVFSTPRGSFQTPCFMPCGTKGAVKTLAPEELERLGCEIILSNTFHLMLRPGGSLIKKIGGLHKWISWSKPILTDSGGFQVYSLSKLRKITDSGAVFQSPIDGAKHTLTPEKAVRLQEQIGADIIMAFDECPPATADYEEAKTAAKRTNDWAVRCLKAKKRKDQALFLIAQGAVYPDLRKESAKFISSLPAPGYAIGGVAVGEEKSQMWEAVAISEPFLPKNKPRYLMGVGEPTDILKAVELGMDMFDCVLPTRLARHGAFWTPTGRENIQKSKNVKNPLPLDKNCECYACRNFSRSYLRHLMMEKEMLGCRLLTIHNLHFLLNLMRQIRQKIASGDLKKFSQNFTKKFHEQKEKDF